MKLKIKATVLALLGLATITFMTGCGDEKSPYETNDSDKYSVSVKYDANGGTFTTNTSVIVDSYNIDDLKENKNGQAEIALLSPDDSSRDEDGNTVYSYSGKWDFENDLLEVDPTKEYSAKEPVLTLYAAWVPLFEIEFYSFDSGEYMDGISYDPTVTTEIQVPAWDEETGETVKPVTLYSINKDGYCHVSEDDYSTHIDEIKPYLFPLSSMTEEQKKEYNYWKHEVPVCRYEYGDVVEEIELYDSPASFEYLIENHFDYRGLIPMGLAEDATDKNIYDYL